jgi:hypothetical protein
MDARKIEDKYSYRVAWSPADKEYVGLCAEFPSLSWLAPSLIGALNGIRKLAIETIRDLHRNGEAIPAPLSGRSYSGQFKIRIPPFMHRRLVLEAEENRVSLNRLISSKLAIS